ncbi:cupin domain-containing protein [Cupriavidus taiwanensis]|uniref:cupin domain-containing protein n=1 Tax=Cupriavidus taiwanensis TaxID=164546 RepID=UPI002541899B|nr:cupin domain-containing protein [Cupriavidus taiwanensis]MDK3025892.1 cupin domain-containing protein [Cupriavidus taiwanensis]
MEQTTLSPEYRQQLALAGLTPLWEHLSNALPHGRPAGLTRANLWRYADVRPLLLQAGEQVPVEKAERRVLVLSDPGRGPASMQATGGVYAGIQLILPGETAPTHRHSPSAARVVIEGGGGFTVVNGQVCPMERGDVILTPSGQWHDHGHKGAGPVTWLDVLDLPVFTAVEAAYAEAGTPGCNVEHTMATLQSQLLRDGLAVPAALRRANPYPMLRFPWARTRAALLELARHAPEGAPVELSYVNPETGESCLPILGFTVLLLPGGRPLAPVQRSPGAVFHVIEGQGESTVDGKTFSWSARDTFTAAAFAEITHCADVHGGPACLLRIDDEPLHRKLGFFQERQFA